MSRQLALRLAAPALNALLLGVVAAAPPAFPVHLATQPAASSGWLDRLNTWRADTGLPALTENSSWSAGDYDHSLYMVKNDLVTHYETPGTPYYTTDGDTAARNGNIYVSSSTATTDEDAIDWWMAAPFHAMGMMDPRLTTTGFGSYREVKSGWDMGATLDVLRGNSFTGGNFPVYFPGNGTSEPLTTYGGNEFPDPLQACSGYSAPTGLPVFVEIGGNVATTATSHSFTGNGVALDHCVIDSNSPSVGSSLTYRGGVIVIPKQALQTGVKYTVALTVNGASYAWSFSVGPFNTCSAVNASASPASPIAPGPAVTFTASATGCPNPLYQFWVQPPGSSTWTIVQPYSTASSFTWQTAGLLAGTYKVSVWAHDASDTGVRTDSLGSYDSYTPLTYSLTGTPCTAVTAPASPVSPSASGTNVTLTASATGCPNPLYQFWIQAPGSGTWKVVQPYSTVATYTWQTTGLLAGTYLISVWAHDAGDVGMKTDPLGSYDTYAPSTYTLNSVPCGSVTDSASPASPSVNGTTVTFTASASGCPNPLYEFWVLPPGSSTWTLVQPYSTASSVVWRTAGMLAGTYRVTVWAHDASDTGSKTDSLGSYDTYAPATYTLSATPCTAVTASATPASPSATGTTITFSASASGCPNPLYEFWIQASGSSTWTIVQPYSTASTFTWHTSGLPVGTYRVSIWAHDTGDTGVLTDSLGSYDTYDPTSYSLSA